MHRATRAALPRLRELFARANDAPYDLVRVAEEKCFENGVAGEPVVTVYGDFLGASVTCGKYVRILAVGRDYRRQGIGTELLREAYGRGATVIGAEAGNYFTPGVYLPSAGFFEKRGRKTAETQNMECSAAVSAAGQAASRRLGVETTPNQPVGTPALRVLDFIEREFGRIWRFEAARAPELLYVEHEGEIAGFAVYEANNRGLGTFGPTGVAKQFRGHGYGRDLLLATLARLQDLGYDRAIIPWTDAIDFYAKSCGAIVAHRFATYLIY